ncbi:MAG: ECF-type sigma factor [Acidobacteriota bacterium]|nr:ECF-type sigma factor [Acidobacteriota bacterium]
MNSEKSNPPTSAEMPGDITRMLKAWSQGDEDALNQLIAMVYGELKKTAVHRMRGESGLRTIQPTALIHEVYLRCRESKNLHFQSRSHFFWFAGQMMRRILVEQFRARSRVKRGAGARHASIVDLIDVPDRPDLDPDTILALDEALTGLARIDPRQARIIELRFFSGLSMEEIAEVLGLSRMTIYREQRMARIWLANTLSKSKPE